MNEPSCSEEHNTQADIDEIIMESPSTNPIDLSATNEVQDIENHRTAETMTEPTFNFNLFPQLHDFLR